jgi:hypothetical protein
MSSERVFLRAPEDDDGGDADDAEQYQQDYHSTDGESAVAHGHRMGNSGGEPAWKGGNERLERATSDIEGKAARLSIPTRWGFINLLTCAQPPMPVRPISAAPATTTASGLILRRRELRALFSDDMVLTEG